MFPGRPSREATLMAVAVVIAARGTCTRAAVGVVIARDGRILSTGYNGTPAGMAHCDHTCDCGKPNNIPSATIDLGHTKDCRSQTPCKQAVHAEANAISYAARHGVELAGAQLYTTFCPCLPCAQLIVSAGIHRVYYKNEYRDRSGLELLQNAGIDMMML